MKKIFSSPNFISIKSKIDVLYCLFSNIIITFVKICNYYVIYLRHIYVHKKKNETESKEIELSRRL